MANLTITKIHVDFDESHEQVTGIASVAIVEGQLIRLDTTTGEWVLAAATSAANLGNKTYMAVESVRAGKSLTGVRYALVDPNGAADALAYDAPVYASDTSGTLADAAGTVSKQVATVFPVFGTQSGTPKKCLLVDLR